MTSEEIKEREKAKALAQIKKEAKEKAEDALGWKAIKWGIMLFFGLVISMMWGCPQYSVWKKGLDGKALLREAEWSRQIVIQEAEATKESASLLAEAEILRAGGVKEANEIIAGGLGGPEGYLRYLFIQVLDSGKNQVIYLPTEAGMPILEARRLPIQTKKED